jgi:hypothetical protein
MKTITKAGIFAGLCMALMASDCTNTDATVVRKNLDTAAEQFELDRRIVFYNVRLGTEIALFEGKCDISDNVHKVQVTCRTGPSTYVRHQLGRGEDVTYLSQQMEGVKTSAYHNRIIWKPQSLVPDIDLTGSWEELTTDFE